MKVGSVDFPEAILSAIRNGELVVFAGSGVSRGKPAELPDFPGLVKIVATGTGESRSENEPEDRFLGRLRQKGVDVHTRAARVLSDDSLEFTDLHQDLVRLYSKIEDVRIVTTNFDVLFEKASEFTFEVEPEVFRAPALPLGRTFRGIVHVHGSIVRPDDMVLTDSDFGRAYLTEGWARRFLSELFRHWTVLFVGYSHNDTIVSYLARALPEVGKRFALVAQQDDLDRWRGLGIEPIAYPLGGNGHHDLLYDAVKRISQLVRRSALDWQAEIEELCQRPPPIDEEATDTIKDALTRIETTRFFIKSARSPDWIDWLDGHKQLDPLFSTESLCERDSLLASWIAETFAVEHAETIFLLLARHGSWINPGLWHQLGREIGLTENENLESGIFCRWISLLLNTSPRFPDEHILLWLGERCASRNKLRCALSVFMHMASPKIELKKNLFFDSQEQQDKVEIELPLLAEHYTLNEVWSKALKPKLNEIWKAMLECSITLLETYHGMFTVWGAANSQWSRVDFHRSAIEPHEQDSYPEPVDVLVDSARDSVEEMVAGAANQADAWIERLLSSDAPILRRIAVHGMTARSDLAYDQKLEWIRKHVGLHDVALHHEVYRLVALNYPKASEDARQSVLNAIAEYHWPHDEDEDRERAENRVKYDWLSWIGQAAPECPLAQAALREIEVRNPDFEAREHVDFTHWTGGGWRSPQSPWTIEQLLSKEASKWLSELLEFRGNSFDGPDREGLGLTVAEAAKRNTEWGLDLVDALVEGENWDADLWSHLFRAFLSANFDQAAYERVLSHSTQPELQSRFPRAIADFYCSLTKDGGKPYALDLMPKVNLAVISLWRSLDRDPVMNNGAEK